MAAKSNQTKKAEKYAKDKALGVKNYTLPTLKATRDAINKLCKQHDFDDWREMLTALLEHAHRLPDDFFSLPRHHIVPTAKALRLMQLQGEIEALLAEDEDE
jgi:hypothetical protein